MKDLVKKLKNVELNQARARLEKRRNDQPPLPPSLLADSPEQQEQYKQELGKYAGARLVKKFELLMDLLKVYGLESEKPETKWLMLSMRLAEDYVPAFKEPIKSAGRKPGKKVAEGLMLVYAVHAVMEAEGTDNLSSAARIVRRKLQLDFDVRQRYKDSLKRDGQAAIIIVERWLDIGQAASKLLEIAYPKVYQIIFGEE